MSKKQKTLGGMDRFEKEKLKQREDHIEKHSEETMDEIRLNNLPVSCNGCEVNEKCSERLKEECYYLKKIPAGDEVYYWCDLDDHPCGKEYNDEECEEYNDQIKEIEKEVKNGNKN